MVERNSISRRIFVILNTLFFITFSFICLAPLLHVLMASISDPRLLMASKGILLKPLGEINLKGYQLVFQNKSILNGYMNTLIYVVATTFLAMTLTLFAGYVLSRKELKLKKPLAIMIIFTMIFNGGLIPGYMVVRGLGMINTRWAIIIPGVINAFYIMMMKSAFEQIPDSYEESAKLDGAGPLTILFRILVPLVKASIAVIVMFNIVGQWNSWFPASIFLTKSRELWPLQLVMREILVQNDVATVLKGANQGQVDLFKGLVKYATIVAGTLPILCVYPFVQKYFVTGITLGGVKG